MKLRDRFGAFCAGLVAGAAAVPLAAHAQDVDTLTGPAADYPIVLGEPYVVDGETFTPVDTMNYDRVGYIAADEDGGGAGHFRNNHIFIISKSWEFYKY